MSRGELSARYRALAAGIEQRFGPKLTRSPTSVADLGYTVDPVDLREVCTVLRDEEGFEFEMLMDVCGVDYLGYGRDEWHTHETTETGFSRGVDEGTVPGSGEFSGSMPDLLRAEEADFQPPRRFAVVYQLLSISLNHRVRLKTFCADDERPIVDSVHEIWNSANWFEREAFDLFGILFRGHPDLRRLLTDYGFIGHPFRKDFPLIGNVEMRYDPEKGRVIYEPVSIEPRTLVPKVIRDDHRYEPLLKDTDDA